MISLFLCQTWKSETFVSFKLTENKNDKKKEMKKGLLCPFLNGWYHFIRTANFNEKWGDFTSYLVAQEVYLSQLLCPCHLLLVIVWQPCFCQTAPGGCGYWMSFSGNLPGLNNLIKSYTVKVQSIYSTLHLGNFFFAKSPHVSNRTLSVMMKFDML